MGNPADFVPQELTRQVMVQDLGFEVETPIKPKPVEPVGSEAYHIICGSFSKLSNAKKESERWKQKGYATQVIRSSKGLNLISIDSSDDKSGLKTRLSTYKLKEISSLWIYSTP